MDTAAHVHIMDPPPLFHARSHSPQGPGPGLRSFQQQASPTVEPLAASPLPSPIAHACICFGLISTTAEAGVHATAHLQTTYLGLHGLRQKAADGRRWGPEAEGGGSSECRHAPLRLRTLSQGLMSAAASVGSRVLESPDAPSFMATCTVGGDPGGVSAGDATTAAYVQPPTTVPTSAL